MLSELASTQPKHLGILLPLSGPLERAGNAIRNGMLTSWYQARDNGQETPKLSFYDTSATEDIQNLYQQAVTNGAETIIGPLSKTKVQRLSELAELPVPILALNNADAQTAKVENFFQFGFPPEDEAIQVANDIWKQGVRSVMVVAPDSTWGIRVSDAFIRHWQLIGGTVASKALFDKPDQYLGAVKKALNVRESEIRHAILQRDLDIDLEFEFRRRQDVDMVFLAAFPAQARQLKPILNYQRASDIPVVAISSIYSGKPDANRDQDLEGIEFIDMPWRLSPSSTKARAIQAFPQSTSSYASLVAFGVDAYRLYPRLRQMSVFSDVRIKGVTGGMTMNDLGRIERKLDWAVIEDGVAVVKQETFVSQLP
jgi:outer membrane PBP1 activator LpoA protein